MNSTTTGINLITNTTGNNDNDEDDFDLFSTVPFNPNNSSSIKSKSDNELLITNSTEVKNSSSNTTTTTYLPTTELTSDYFRCIPGTIIGSHYVVKGKLGDGVFSTVVLVQKNDLYFAAKVLRGNETMQRAGEKELQILTQLHQPTPHPNLVTLIDSFQLLDKHLVLVFERMEMNLRVCLDTFGKNVGINLDGVRSYLWQLFSALERLASMKVVHADLKPDNILVSSDLTQIKIADFGSCIRLDQDIEMVNQPTPYLVSRYYRAPEIILGTSPITCAVDIWAVAVTGFELCTGKVCFPGQTNNDQLFLIQKCLGRFNNSTIKKHITIFRDKLEKEPHFVEDGSYKFKSHEIDPVNPNIVIRRLIQFPDSPSSVENSIRGQLIKNSSTTTTTTTTSSSTTTLLFEFILLLEACLKLDPESRIDASKALKMKFFQSPGNGSSSSSSNGNRHNKHHYTKRLKESNGNGTISSQSYS
jgi:serine/threonine-protein kinase PRP4